MATITRRDRAGATRQALGILLLAATLPAAAIAEPSAIDDPKDPMYWIPPKGKPAPRTVLAEEAFAPRFAAALKELDLAALEKSREPDRAVRVVGVTRGGTADRLGIVFGDLILEVDGTPVTTPRQFNALRKKEPQLLAWQTAAGTRKEGDIQPGKIGIRSVSYDRPELRYLRGKNRNARWDREMVVALARYGRDPDLAETCLARAAAAGCTGPVMDRAVLDVSYAQARYDAVMDQAWLMLQADPKSFDIAHLFANAALYSYKLPAACMMLERFPEMTPSLLTQRSVMEQLINEHRALPPERRLAPPPSETARNKLRDDLLLRAKPYGPPGGRPHLPKDPFETHKMNFDSGLIMTFGPPLDSLEIQLDFALHSRVLDEEENHLKEFRVRVGQYDGDDPVRGYKSHNVLTITFTVWRGITLQFAKIPSLYDEQTCPAPLAGFTLGGDNVLRIIADAGRLEAFLNGRRLFYGPLLQGDRQLFEQYRVSDTETRITRLVAFELVDPDDTKAPSFRDINKAYLGGQTRLHRAVDVGPAEDIPRWLAHGADPNAKDGQGLTPLMIAAQRGREDVVAHLLGKGADVNATDKKGKTAVDHAKANGKNAVVELLQKRADAPK